MTYSRTIELNLSEEFTEAIGGMPDKGAERAIGYLAHWAIGGMRFAKAKITGDKDGNLTALYLNADGSLGYEIFAMRNGAVNESATYSFHS